MGFEKVSDQAHFPHSTLPMLEERPAPLKKCRVVVELSAIVDYCFAATLLPSNLAGIYNQKEPCIYFSLGYPVYYLKTNRRYVMD